MEKNSIKFQAINSVEEEIKKELKSGQFNGSDNLIEKGLSSIMIMKISSKLRQFGIRISFTQLMEKPTFNQWKLIIDNTEIKKNKNKRVMDKTYQKYQSKEFPLTDIQHSYWVGRDDDQPLGGVGCHAYLEIDGQNVEVDILNKSWNFLQQYHPMLRAKFTVDGMQKIMDRPYSTQIGVYDLRHKSKLEIKKQLQELRETISHRKLRIEEGQVAGISIALLPDNNSKLFFDIDLLICDVLSLSILIEDLAKIYNGDCLETSSKYTFKEYIEDRNTDTVVFEEDKVYWRNKIKTLSKESPNLPIKKKPEFIKKPIFKRRKKVVEKSVWERVKGIASKYKMTPSMVLLTCYTLIIERWCNQDKFLINMPLFNRDTENKNLENMVADFTNLLLIDYERKEDETFLETLRRIYKVFLENISHSSYSGVKVQRDIYKEIGSNNFIAPIVFACNLDYSLETALSQRMFGKISYMISQTPQVWLDFQSYIIDESLVLCWDAIEELYPENLLDDMFNSLVKMIYDLSDKDNWNIVYDVLAENQKKEREKELRELLPLKYPNKTLYSDFINNVKKYPDRIALIDGITEEHISYKDLYDKALKIASILVKNGICKGDYIGVTLPRGCKQIYAILGILFSGGVYIPIGINQPNDRRDNIYDQMGIKYVVSDLETIENYNLSNKNISLIDLDNNEHTEHILNKPIKITPQNSSYVIMTSGSTGIPKGVEIGHENAVNTILDINDKYNINNLDTVLMVSAIDFDLSVYDIFGLLTAGGKIIILDEQNYKNPDLWIKLIEKYKVTLWNSVPILFDMLVTMAEGKNVKIPLRVVMLSGDWIDMDLPSRFYSRSIGATVVAMGGATEASIWSNYLNVPKEIPNEWISIPYGKPLKNQIYRVIDGFGRICPNYVKGELWIGGVGLAKCYRGDHKLTNEKFVKDKIRWYKTGYNGRIWQDATIEFLGRKDNQIKIKGYRIELGEIKSALKSIDFIDDAVVDVYSDYNGERHIVAYLEIDNGEIVEERGLLIKDEEWEKYKLKELGCNNEDKFKQILNYSNVICCKTMLSTLKEMNVLQEKVPYTFNEVIDKAEIDSSQISTIKKWLNDLILYKFLELRNGSYVYNCDKDSILYSGNEIDVRNINLYIDKIKKYLSTLLRGKINPIEVYYSEGEGLAPNDLARALPGLDELVEILLIQLKKIFTNTTKKIKILEYGTRDFEITKKIIGSINNNNVEYVYSDSSLMYINKAKNLLSKYPFVKFKLINLESDSDELNVDSEYDCIIMINSLHRMNNLQKAFNNIKNILDLRGIMLILELTIETCLQDITAQILSGRDTTDSDEGIHNSIQWNSIIRENGFNKINFYPEISSAYGRNIITVMNIDKKQKFDIDKLKLLLESKIPSYMIPQRYHILNKFPINKNGKLDMKVLGKLNTLKSKKCVKSQSNISDIETKVRDIWEETFQIKGINIDDNYYTLGGDSLIATRMVGKIRAKFGVSFSIKDIMALKNIKDQAIKISYFLKTQSDIKNLDLPVIFPDKDHKNDKFILTDIQQAYLIGRSGTHNLGGVSTHCYFELDSENINLERLQATWNDMIKYHGMMRAVIFSDGTQKILESVPEYEISISDISHLDSKSAGIELDKVRDEMSHQVLSIEHWPLFDVRATIINKNKIRIHISFDNIIFDGWSMFYLLSEWKERYYNEISNYPDLAINFRDYVLGLEKIKKTLTYEKDKKYWCNRINNFLTSPQLPLVKKESEIKEQKFNRRTSFINKVEWDILKNIAKTNEITPTILLITIYSEVIRNWSYNKDFVLNITQFNRIPLHSEVNKLVGDFTTLTLLEVKNSAKVSLANKAKALQKQMTEDLEHKTYGAIELQRELRRRSGNIKGSIMPIVFTSGLGINSWGKDKWIGELVYNISQTPQVWLDHQVIENNKGISIFWDSIDELFISGVLDEMFKTYIEILKRLVNKPFEFNEDISFFKQTHTASTNKSNDNYINIIDNKTEIINKEELKVEEARYKDLDFLDDETYKILCMLQDVLGCEISSMEDRFFQLGGDSLKAIKFVNIIKDEIRIEINLNLLFDNPTIKILLIEIKRLKEEKYISCEGSI